MVLWLLPGSGRRPDCEGHLGHPQHAEGVLQVPPRLGDSEFSADVIVRQGQQWILKDAFVPKQREVP